MIVIMQSEDLERGQRLQEDGKRERLELLTPVEKTFRISGKKIWKTTSQIKIVKRNIHFCIPSRIWKRHKTFFLIKKEYHL